MRAALAEGFQVYVNELSHDLAKKDVEWNDPRNTDAQRTALLCLFATFCKRYNIPVKAIGRTDIDKIPTYLNKKLKSKKPLSCSSRNHYFVENIFSSSKLTCVRCNQPFWGIGYQGYICQSN